MKCPYCGSEKHDKVGYSMFEDMYVCNECDEEFDTPRDKSTDPKEWVEPKSEVWKG